MKYSEREFSENSFSVYFDLRTLLHYLHFIQVTNPFIIYSRLSFRHVEPCSIEGQWFDSRWGLREFFFRVFRLENASPLLTLYVSFTPKKFKPFDHEMSRALLLQHIELNFFVQFNSFLHTIDNINTELL